MKLNNKYIKALFALAMIFPMGSCSNGEDTPGGDLSSEVKFSAEIHKQLKLSSRAEEGPDGTEYIPDAGEKAESYYDLAFNENSVLFVSQMTETTKPFLKEDMIFSYQYFDEGEETGWMDPPEGPGGYNFTPLANTTPLEWKDIKANGFFQNGYALFALYYPVGNTIRYDVETDQNSLDNLMKSDVLGAYHSTSALFTRIKFNLFHLMTYLKVTVFVPIYDETSKTGFFSDSFVSATLLNAYKDFVIDWGTIRSSDTEGPVTLYDQSAEKVDINMFTHPRDVSTDKIVDLRYKDYVNDTFTEQPVVGDFDKVRVMNFSVIVPVQPADYAQNDFFKFVFRTLSGEEKTYYFNFSQYAGGTNSDIKMNQGTLQHFLLYLPRKGRQAVLMKADVINWEDYYTELPLTPDE